MQIFNMCSLFHHDVVVQCGSRERRKVSLEELGVIHPSPGLEEPSTRRRRLRRVYKCQLYRQVTDTAYRAHIYCGRKYGRAPCAMLLSKVILGNIHQMESSLGMEGPPRTYHSVLLLLLAESVMVSL
jgi:hypothetical protein